MASKKRGGRAGQGKLFTITVAEQRATILAIRAERTRELAARVTHAFLSIRYYMAGAKKGRLAGYSGGYEFAAWQLGAVAAWRKIAAEALAAWRAYTGWERFLGASPVREGAA